MNRREAITALMSLPSLSSIQAVRMATDDVIVIEVEERLSAQHRENITEQITKLWPGRRVVVLDGGMKMKIVDGTLHPKR